MRASLLYDLADYAECSLAANCRRMDKTMEQCLRVCVLMTENEVKNVSACERARVSLFDGWSKVTREY